MSLPIAEALPRVVDSLLQADLKSRISVIAAGKLITSAKAAWALCVGADFVNTARGFMFALGCIQALRCLPTPVRPASPPTMYPYPTPGVRPAAKAAPSAVAM